MTTCCHVSHPWALMTIQLPCPNCGARLKVKDEMAGRSGKCPACKTRVAIPAAAPETDDDLLLDDPDEPRLPAHETAAATQLNVPTETGDAPIPFDSLDDDEPPPQIIVSGAMADAKEKESEGEEQQHPSAKVERIFNPDDVPSALGKLNHYLICDHKDIVGRWENDGRGWMIHLKDGFVRAATVSQQIPTFGSFVLIEVAVEKRDDGLHLQGITPWTLKRQYALIKLAKGDDAILEAVTGYAELNDRQRQYVRELIKAAFLPKMWGVMDQMLEEC